MWVREQERVTRKSNQVSLWKDNLLYWCLEYWPGKTIRTWGKLVLTPLLCHSLSWPTCSLPSHCLCFCLHTCPAPLLFQGDEEQPSLLVQTPEGTDLITRQRLYMPAHLVGHLDQVSRIHRTEWHCSLTPSGRTISGSQGCWGSKAWSLKCPVHVTSLLTQSVT